MALAEGLLFRSAVEVPPPEGDPCYAAPENEQAMAPGEIVAARRVEIRGLRRRETVMNPRRPFDGSVRPLLSYQPAIDSLGSGGDPSHAPRRGMQWELAFMSRSLRRGWAVVATDYTGPRRAFAAGVLAGRLVLDGIRAAVTFEPSPACGSGR